MGVRLLRRLGSKMLVWSRKRDESIIIGDDVVVTVFEIGGDKVELGTDAPDDFPILRGELYDYVDRNFGRLIKGHRYVEAFEFLDNNQSYTPTSNLLEKLEGGLKSCCVFNDWVKIKLGQYMRE